MEGLLFLCVYALLPIVVIWLLHLAGESLFRLSIVSVATISLYVFSVVGTLPLFYQWDVYRVQMGVTDPSLVLKVLLYSGVNILFFLLGVIAVRALLGWRPLLVVSAEIRALRKPEQTGLFLLFLLCAFVLAIYLTRVGQVALFVAIEHGAEAAKVARSAMGNAFPGKYHWYKLVMDDFGNLVTFTAFIAWVRSRRLGTCIVFLIALSYSVFVAIMATEKAPLAWLLIGLFICYAFARWDGRLPAVRGLFFAILLLAVLGTLYVYFMGSADFLVALSSVFSRAFSGSIAPAYFYLEYVPAHHGYFWGSTISNIGGIFPYEPVRYTVEIMNWRFPELAREGIIGSMPTVFWGEAYLNFGVVAIPVIGFMMGVMVAVVSYLVSKIELTPLSLALTAWIVIDLKSIAFSGFSEFLPDFYMAGVCLVYLAVWSSVVGVRIRRRDRPLREANDCS